MPGTRGAANPSARLTLFPCLDLPFHIGNILGLQDALDFRSVSAQHVSKEIILRPTETRSGRSFSPWESAVIESPAFAIVSAVIAAAEAQADEDLAQADTGFPHSLHDLDGSCEPTPEPESNAPLTAASAPTPSAAPVRGSSKRSTSRVAREKASSKIRRTNHRQSLKVQAYLDLLPPQRQHKHIKKAPAAIKARFDLMKTRVAATGWISLRDDGRSSPERDAGFQEPGWHPSHTLDAFFGPQPKFSGFTLVKSQGQCVISHSFPLTLLICTSQPSPAHR